MIVVAIIASFLVVGIKQFDKVFLLIFELKKG